jgi:hypothetical protein
MTDAAVQFGRMFHTHYGVHSQRAHFLFASNMHAQAPAAPAAVALFTTHTPLRRDCLAMTVKPFVHHESTNL